jgi:hypothetical protein
MADVPKDKAVVLLSGIDINGNAVERYLDGPPSFDDLARMTVVNIVGLRPVIRRKALKPPPPASRA